VEPAGRLNSWKEIAAYLGVSARTAQRWERAEGLPARRHKHDVLSSVFAYPSEIDQWWHRRPDLQRLSVAGQTSGASIAVPPFINLNHDEENEILSEGLTEELINSLARVDSLHVVARTSCFQFKGTTADVRTIGRRLGVGTILEGSLRRTGQRLRVTAQLINAIDGYHLWSERLDWDMTGIFDLQEVIARAIVEALRVRLEKTKPTRQYGQDPAIYAMYLEGRYHCSRRTRAGFLKAVECFEQILVRDERVAEAWAGLADCHAFLGHLAGIPASEALPRAKTAASRALELDGSLPDAHCSLGFVTALFEYDWPRAEDHFRRALDVNPGHANAHMWYGGHVLAPQGRLKEAAVHARRACELDPLSAPAISGLAGSYLMSRQPEEAVSACHKALALDPAYPVAQCFLGQAYLLKNMHAEAAVAFSKVKEPLMGAGFLGYCHAHNGREYEARQVLQQLEKMAAPLAAFQIAIVYLGLGEADAAFNWLQKAFSERSTGVHWLKVQPIWDALRTDVRFAAILKDMRLSD
jgi:TolB-like protein/tetratricopeptide (TPR) repeat protein